MLQTALKTATLPVMEHFYTLQGEGAYTGVAAYFVRLGGCNVGCHWCDVKESWQADAHPTYPLDEIESWWQETAAPVVVVTGGEPLMHDCSELVEAIHATGRRAHVETSGTQPITGAWDWITLSPKKFKPALPECFAAASELKIVAFHSSDLSWALEQARLVSHDCKLYIQPEWSRHDKMAPLLVEFVKANPTWRLSLQTHKFIAIP